MAFLTSQFHNYAHSLGYSLDNGVTSSVGDFVEEIIVFYIRQNKLRYPRATFCGEYDVKIDVSKSWVAQKFDNKKHEDVEPIIATFAKYMVYYACILANAHGRKQVKACDVILLRSFACGLFGYIA